MGPKKLSQPTLSMASFQTRARASTSSLDASPPKETSNGNHEGIDASPPPSAPPAAANRSADHAAIARAPPETKFAVFDSGCSSLEATMARKRKFPDKPSAWSWNAFCADALCGCATDDELREAVLTAVATLLRHVRTAATSMMSAGDDCFARRCFAADATPWRLVALLTSEERLLLRYRAVNTCDVPMWVRVGGSRGSISDAAILLAVALQMVAEFKRTETRQLAHLFSDNGAVRLLALEEELAQWVDHIEPA
jgi:hypothetical protein